MSERVPERWQVVPLRDHSERVRRKNTTGNKNVLTASAQFGLVNQRDFFNKAVSSEDTSHYTLLEKGDFAYNKSYSNGYPVGVIRRLSKYNTGVLSPLYICFSISSKDCNADFLSYYFDSYKFERQLSSVVQEGARAHGLLNIIVDDFFNRELLLPPFSEQKKIASILTSVDEVIENSEKQIDKLQDLKKATMNDLLTKGIGHTEFKSSKLGRIPKTWEVRQLSELCIGRFGIVDGPFGSNLKLKHYRRSGVPVIQSGFVTSGTFIAKNYVYVDEEKFNLEIRSAVRGGDIVMAKIGSAGKCAIMPESHPIGLLAGNSLKISVNESMLSNIYLHQLLTHLYITGDIQALITKTAQPAISIATLKKFRIKAPPISEQNKIVEILESINSQLKMRAIKLKQIQSLKKSLMQDLLTGKVRVKVN